MANALSDQERALMDAYWRAANYLSVGQIYLYDNPLLKQTLTKEHIKPRLLGHWGTTPGLNFIYVHLNRLIKKHDLNMIYITGPGHGGPGPGRERLPRGDIQRGISEHFSRRRGHEAPLHAVFVSRGHPEPCGTGNARLHSRRGRTRLCRLARLRSGFRQSRSDRRLRRRRRRGGDRSAGDQLALQQIPEPGDGWSGSADPSPQRLQDRQSLRPGSDQPRGIGPPVPRLWLHPALRRGG